MMIGNTMSVKSSEPETLFALVERVRRSGANEHDFGRLLASTHELARRKAGDGGGRSEIKAEATDGKIGESIEPH